MKINNKQLHLTDKQISTELACRSKLQKQFKKKLLAGLCCLGFGLMAHTSLAQIGSATIKGVIESEKTPQTGVEVFAKNVDNGFVYKTITLKDGSYALRGLNPGHYQIFLGKDKTQKSQDMTLEVGQNVALDFNIAKPTSEAVEEVVVTGTKVIANVGGEIGTNVSQQQINRLPQNTRNFLAFADLAPGVQFTQSDDGSTKIKSGAQGANAINVFIDGVGQKNYVTGGGITGQDSSRGNPFPQSAISQYKIITQNYSAEYDQLSSAAIVAVTASGGNEFHGSIFYDFTNDDMRAASQLELRDHNKIKSKQSQYGFSVGGPIIQDKMHFFFAYEAKDNSDPKEIVPDQSKTASDLPTQYQALVGGAPARFAEDLYFGKIDWAVTDNQLVELTSKIRKENELTNLGGSSSVEHASDKVNDETRYDLRYKISQDTWVNDAHLTYENSSFNPRAHLEKNGVLLKNMNDDLIFAVGGGEDYQNKGQKGLGLQEDFTYTAIEHHQLKTGLKYKSVELHAVEQQPYNPQYSYDLEYIGKDNFDPINSVPYAVRWGAPLSNIGDGGLKTDSKQFGIYIQDDWIATENLTLNAGIRWDYETSSAYLNYVTPQDVVNGIANWDAIKNSNINIQDFVSNGHNRESFKNGFQPRLGFTYKLDEEHNTELFGGMGRAFDRNLFDYLQVESTKATYPTFNFQFSSPDPRGNCNLSDSGCVIWDKKYLTRAGLNSLVTDQSAGREVDLLNNKLRTPYSDQFSFGVRGGLNEKWRAEVSLSHVVSKDGFVWMLANRNDDGSFFPNSTATWGTPWNKGIPGLGNTLIGLNGLQTKTNSLFVKLDKPKTANDFGLSLAYTYSVGKSTLKDGEHYAFDYPSLSGYGMNDAINLPTHRLVATFMSDLPGGIDFTSKLNLQSQRYYIGTNCLAGWDYCKYSSFKPKAGTFAYKQLDMSFAKSFTTNFLSKDSQLTARLDILNITNAINYEGYNDWFGTPDDGVDANFGKPQGTLAGPTRTFKFGLTWDW